MGGRVAHHFGAACDDAIFHAAHHTGGSEIHRADPAATKTIERRAARLGVKASRQCRHAAEVAALLAVLRRGRPYDVVERRGVEIVAIADRGEDRTSTRLNSSQ